MGTFPFLPKALECFVPPRYRWFDKLALLACMAVHSCDEVLGGREDTQEKERERERLWNSTDLVQCSVCWGV